MNKHLISVYSKQDSKIKLFIKENVSYFKDFNFVFYDISKTLPPQKVIGSLIILEETSFEQIFLKFSEMLDSYKYKPFFVVCSEEPTIKSAVEWMKLGADNYIEVNEELTCDILVEVLNQSVYFENKISSKNISVRKPFDYPPISLNHKIDWVSLKEGKEYNMSLLSVSIFYKNKKNKFLDEHLDNILMKINSSIEKTISVLGGRNLFWQLSTGIFLFHFDDRISCAVASAISVLNKILLYTIEHSAQLSGSGVGVKIVVHDGGIIYNLKDTRFITSDALNSVAHLQDSIDEINCIIITENVFEDLNPRLKRYFYRMNSYEGREIYNYYNKF